MATQHLCVWLNSSLVRPAWENPALSGLWPSQGMACQPEDTALIQGISHQTGSWGQRLAVLPAAILQDVLVTADNAKARTSIWNSMVTYQQVPSDCATELALHLLSAAAPPQPALSVLWPFAGLELAGLSCSQHKSGATGTLLASSFKAAGQASPPRNKTAFPLPPDSQALQSQALLDAHSIIPFTCVSCSFDCLFL